MLEEPEKYLKVALHFESHNEEENEKLMDYIATRKDEIEKRLEKNHSLEKWEVNGEKFM